MFNFDLSFLNVFKKVEVFQGNLARGKVFKYFLGGKLN